MRRNTLVALLISVTLLLQQPNAVDAGLVAYGACQTACNVAAEACYSAAGCIFGTVFAIFATPAILACNAAQSACMIACVPLLAAPGP
ncbi:hypothetical protein TKK_0013051 [Trichogramma kaykai]